MVDRCFREARAPAIRVEDKNIFLSGEGIVAQTETSAREAYGAFSQTWLDEPERLLTEVVDPLVLFLLTHSGRIPVHASALLLGDTAVVLAGRSGSGKSSLALAAHHAGLPVMSDDTVYVQLEPHFAVHAAPRPIHVFAQDAPAGHTGTFRLRSGKWKTALPLPADAPRHAHRAALCVLEKGDRVALEAIDIPTTLERLTGDIEAGFDLFRDEMPTAIRALAANGAWRLQLSRDPAEAIARLVARFGGR